MRFSVACPSSLRPILPALFAAIFCGTLPAQSNNAPPPQAAPQQPNGKVIFSRSTDESGQDTTTAGSPTPQLAPAPIATDDERKAVTFVAFDMDVHLHTADHAIAVRALVTVRNDAQTPLLHIPL